jgi:hypothetical protein
MKAITPDLVIALFKEQPILLHATHHRLCFPIIQRIYKKMLLGIKFSPIKIADDFIVDGHHRYVASLLAKKNIDCIPSLKTAATLKSDWSSIQLDLQDWDTAAKIQILNEEDAHFNGIDIERIIDILK